MNITRTLESDHYLVTHEVGPNQHGVRLDNFLKDRYRRRSREQLKRAIDEGVVTIEREGHPHMIVGRLKPSYNLVPGDRVMVLSERKPEPEVCFDYRVIFDDDEFFIIDKPANLPVHPAGRYFFNTLLVHLKTQGHTKPLRAERDFFLVHRIDKETSGVLVLAKDRVICAGLTKQFAARTTEKRYLAVVKGITPENFACELALGKDKNSAVELAMTTVPEAEGGMPANTGFRRLETAGDYSLVECLPKTGRQHQIRVHLFAMGFPLVGDKLYGIDPEIALSYANRTRLTPEAEARLILPRHALHSSWIRFTHPLTGRPMEFSAEIPADMRTFLDSQRTCATKKVDDQS